MNRLTATVGILTVLAVYLLGATGGFIADDYTYIVENDNLLSLRASELWTLFIGPKNLWSEYLPIRDFSLWLDMALFGKNPLPFKIHNILLYGLVCAAVWLFVREIFLNEISNVNAKENVTLFAAVATLIFASHPAHVEAVSWISGRKDLLSALFAILALWRFAAAYGAAGPVADGRKKVINIAAASLLFLLAVLSKGAVLTLPALALLYSVRHYLKTEPLRQAAARAVTDCVPLFLVAFAAFAVHSHFGEAAGISIQGERFTPEMQSDTLNRALLILGYLAKIVLFPFQLRVIYDVYDPTFEFAALLGGSAAMLVSIVGSALYLKRGNFIGLGTALFLVFCLPYLQLSPFETWSLASERFVFLPVLGFSICVAALVVKLPGKAYASAVVAGFFVTGILLTGMRSAEWKSHETLWTSNSQNSPGNFLGAFFLIHQVLVRKGDFVSAREVAARIRIPEMRQIVETYVQFEQAIANQNTNRIAQTSVQIHNSIVNVKKREVLRDIQHIQFYRDISKQIIRGYTFLLELKPENGSLSYNLGLLQQKVRAYGDAEKSIRKALPNLPKEHLSGALNNLGHLLWKLDKPEEAIETFNKAMEISPTEWLAAASLARVYQNKGDDEKAAAFTREARLRAEKAGADQALIEQAIAADW